MRRYQLGHHVYRDFLSGFVRSTTDFPANITMHASYHKSGFPASLTLKASHSVCISYFIDLLAAESVLTGLTVLPLNIGSYEWPIRKNPTQSPQTEHAYRLCLLHFIFRTAF